MTKEKEKHRERLKKKEFFLPYLTYYGRVKHLFTLNIYINFLTRALHIYYLYRCTCTPIL